MSRSDGQPACPDEERVRLLLVDDDDSARITLAIALRRHGFEVRVAEDGDAALRILSQQRVDWVISDIRMPGMTGIELASKINLLFHGVRCILVSAFAMADELTELGVIGCLEKPIDTTQLLDLLQPNGHSHNGHRPAA